MFIITQVLKSVKSTQFHGKIPPMFDCHSSSTGLVGTINWLNRDRVANSLSTKPRFIPRKNSGNRDQVPTGKSSRWVVSSTLRISYMLKDCIAQTTSLLMFLFDEYVKVFTLAFVNWIIGLRDLSNYQISPVRLAPHNWCKHNLLIGLKQSQYGP